MSIPLRLLTFSLLILGLSACASTQDRRAYVEPERTLSPGEVRFEQDAEYIGYVERIARRRGITVQWVHPPTKRVKSE
ncbi:MAG: hypothetical protein M3485_08510 [Pseudomonadota bacterium]|nr:hypothetical protein [Pseudomonadota bacterium]